MKIRSRGILARRVACFSVFLLTITVGLSEDKVTGVLAGTTATTCVNNPVVTSTADSGPGSLRDAISGACPGSKITFAITGVIILAGGELEINQDVTIQGPGAGLLTISGNKTALHVFNIGDVAPAVDVTISGLKITGGNADGSGSDANGGGVVYNGTGALTLVACTISRNTASGSGGGIFNGSGTVTISNSTISKNTATGSGGGVFNDKAGEMMIATTVISGNAAMFDAGGGVSNSGMAAIDGSTISRNNAGRTGGGISSLSAELLNVSNCTISGNDAPFGAGIFKEGTMADITGSAIVGNNASEGGGIFIEGPLNVSNSTISGNTATNFPGGGLYNFVGTTTMTNCTISGNRVINSDGGGAVGGDITNILNTIVALNTADSDPDVAGVFTSQGHNFIGKADGSFGFSNGVNGDMIGSIASPLNPELGPLQNNGGPTVTQALRKSSAAINAGDDSVLGPPLLLSTDQRGPGFPRKVGAHVDIGAFEYQHVLKGSGDPNIDGLKQILTSRDCLASLNRFIALTNPGQKPSA